MQLDASTPIPLVLYGVPFHNVTFEEALDWIVARVRSGRPAHIVTANLDFVTQAWNDPELQRLLLDADLVLADGFPMVKLSPLFGPPLKGRVTGSDLTPLLVARAAQEGLSVYGLGSAAGVAQKALDLLKERHPDLKIAGTFSPPFADLLEMDHRAVLHRLEDATPDLLFVAFGAPKQDKFIRMHVRGWKVPIAMGVGASLDFIAGEQTRAPKWVQKGCGEWIWRLGGHPRRLFSRYFSNLRFLCSASFQMVRIHHLRDRLATFQPLEQADVQALEKKGVTVAGFHPLENEAMASEFVHRMVDRTPGQNLLLDVHTVPGLNSLELGALLEVNKGCHQWGKRLILYAPRPKVLRLLQTCRLSEYFDVATQLDEVMRIVKNRSEHLEGSTAFDQGRLTLELPIELTAETRPSFEQDVSEVHRALQRKGVLKTIEVDASQLDFIDSAGLGFLISLKKTSETQGISMSIVHLDAKPRRTFEIARVDKILLHA
ncbi:MAG: WecB/TagA/CpsF family glycosyltransferase [Pontiella sp.]